MAPCADVFPALFQYNVKMVGEPGGGGEYTVQVSHAVIARARYRASASAHRNAHEKSQFTLAEIAT